MVLGEGAAVACLELGKHENAQLFLGANPKQVDAVDGVLFSVWAPDASRVSVVGDFNHWNGVAHGMRRTDLYGRRVTLLVLIKSTLVHAAT